MFWKDPFVNARVLIISRQCTNLSIHDWSDPCKAIKGVVFVFGYQAWIFREAGTLHSSCAVLSVRLCFHDASVRISTLSWFGLWWVPQIPVQLKLYVMLLGISRGSKAACCLIANILTAWQLWNLWIMQMWQQKNTWRVHPAQIHHAARPKRVLRIYLFPT